MRAGWITRSVVYGVSLSATVGRAAHHVGLARLHSPKSACVHRNHYAIRLPDAVHLGLVGGESCISRYRYVSSASKHLERQSGGCRMSMVSNWIDDGNPTPFGAQLTKVISSDWS